MTCIAGLVSDGKVWMAGDSLGAAGWDMVIRADRKVFRNGPYVMGFTTSYRMGQLLRYGFTPPTPPANGSLEEFMVGTFIEAVRERLKAGGFAKKDNEQESGGTFLVGVRGRLFEIGPDYQVGENSDGFGAVGAGDQVAHGALYATEGKDPVDRLIIALSAAERFSAAVRRPFVIRCA